MDFFKFEDIEKIMNAKFTIIPSVRSKRKLGGYMKTAENYVVERIEKLEDENKELNEKILSKEQVICHTTREKYVLNEKYKKVLSFLSKIKFKYDAYDEELKIDGWVMNEAKYDKKDAGLIYEDLLKLEQAGSNVSILVFDEFILKNDKE